LIQSLKSNWPAKTHTTWQTIKKRKMFRVLLQFHLKSLVTISSQTHKKTTEYRLDELCALNLPAKCVSTSKVIINPLLHQCCQSQLINANHKWTSPSPNIPRVDSIDMPWYEQFLGSKKVKVPSFGDIMHLITKPLIEEPCLDQGMSMK